MHAREKATDTPDTGERSTGTINRSRSVPRKVTREKKGTRFKRRLYQPFGALRSVDVSGHLAVPTVYLGHSRTSARTSYAVVSLEAERMVRSFTAGKRLTSSARSAFRSSSSPASTALNRLLGF